MHYLYPIRLEASLHETIWGGRGLERDGWKRLPAGEIAIGEAWETEISNTIHNGPYSGITLGSLVKTLGPDLLGAQAVAVFGNRFPLLAKFIDANAQLSVQVHPNDMYAAAHEGGKLGKTEYWYILAAQPGATIVHGFKAPTSRAEVQRAIEQVTLDSLLHEEVVFPGDIIFVPAGTVHAIGKGIVLYELQEYSDVTYRMYDYGRLTASGKPRELHIEHSLDVAHFGPSQRIKMKPVALSETDEHTIRCLIACQYFVTCEVYLKAAQEHLGRLSAQTGRSCVILSSLGAEARIHYSAEFEQSEQLALGQTVVLPAGLGRYELEGSGRFLLSYVPDPDDAAWKQWRTKNEQEIF